MLNPFQKGDQKRYSIIVSQNDIAQFADGGIIHEVYSTFAITRDAEWSTRLFVNEMLEEDEAGIGTFVNVIHHAPARVGANVIVISTFHELRKNEIICNFEVYEGDRLLASGKTGQKIVKKEKLEKIMKTI